MSKKIFNLIFALLLSLTTLSPVYAENEAPEPTEDTSQEVEETPTPESTPYTEEGFFDVKETLEYIEEGDFVVEEVSPTVEEIVYYCNKEEHTHSDECFDNYRVLICEDESEEHKHNEECFKEYSFMICEKEEHVHDENCLNENYEEPIIEVDEVALEQQKQFEELLNKALNEEDGYFLNCKKTEHTHTPECFEYKEDLICEKEEILDKEDENYHIHADECYEKYYIVICEEKEEHTHTMDCISHRTENGEVENVVIEVPSEIFDEEIDHSDIPADETIEEETPIRQLMRAPRLLGSANGVNIREFVVQQFYGGVMQSGKYVWNANYNTSGHRFSFRLNYALGGVGELDANSVIFTVPKQILRDRNNNFAGTYEMSVPSKRDIESGEELDAEISFAYYEDGNNIKIYNFKPISAGSNGYIELSYITNKTATNYEDMGKSDDFVARMDVTNNEQTINSTSDIYNVYINTNSKINSVVKGPNGYPSRYSSWQSSWGTTPANADDYYYLVWTIRTTVAEPVTQPYNFTLQDTLQTVNSEVVGYKFSGQSTYSTNNTVTNQTSEGYRYDYVLTRHPKSYWQPLTHWSIKNSVTGVVDPVDQADADTKSSASQTYVWNKPVFEIPTGHFISRERADGWWRELDAEDVTWKDGIVKTPLSNLGFKNNEYTRYDLEELQDGTVEYLDNLDYAVWMEGYPYPWTYQGNNPKNPDNYGKLPVKFELINDGTYIWDEAAGLNKNTELDYNDFQIDTLSYEMYISKVVGFDEEHQVYNTRSNEYDSSDILNFYAKFGSNNDWILVATYEPLNKTVWFDSQYIESMNSSEITFKDNCVAYKIDTTNKYYYTKVNTVPSMRLKNSAKVMDFIQNKVSVGIYNEQKANFYKHDGSKIVDWTEGDSNFVRVTKRDSYIFKDSTSATNNVKKKTYAITWKVGMTEQYVAGEGEINYINQESGIFYDLLPIGSNLDINSVSVRAGTSSRFSNAVDTAEQMKYRIGQFLPNTAYTVEQIPNYKGSGRTLLIVKIKEGAKYYDIFFDTIHSWDSIADWGNNVYNPIAYETGNDKIKYGTNNDGGQIREKQLMTNLPSEAQGEKFIYAEAEYDIATITAASTGLTKKVRALDDNDFSYDTVTTNDGNYEYRWRLASSNTSKTKNIILFDSTENYIVEGKASDWHGTIQSIDLSQPKSMGINPILYYSTVENLDIETNHDITNSSVWQRLTEQTDLSTIKALAADLRKTTSGSDFILEEGQSLSIILHMKAPHGAESQGTYPEAYNNIYLQDTVIGLSGDPQDFFIHQDYTTVRFLITEDLTLKKVSSEDNNTPLKDIKFRLRGTSDYGTEEDRIIATDNTGIIVFKDIEKGSYILSEYESTKDWLLNPAEFTVTVDAEGVLSITGQENSNFLDFTYNNEIYTLTVKDDPRVHGNVTLLKKREGTTQEELEKINEIRNTPVGGEVEIDGDIFTVEEQRANKAKLKIKTPQVEAYAKLVPNNDAQNSYDLIFYRDEPGLFNDKPNYDSHYGTWTDSETNITYISNIENMYEGFESAGEIPFWGQYHTIRNIEFLDYIQPKNISRWFADYYGMQILNDVDISKLDTSKTKYFIGTLQGNANKVDESLLNTSEAINLSGMFVRNESTTALDLMYFNTSNVTDMSGMFNHIGILESLDLSSFNTSNVTDMTGMFNSSPDLKNIYVSERWNMDSVIFCQGMFGGAESLPNYNFDESYNNEKQYAHYNEGGYLTYKAFDQSELDPDHLYGGELWYSYETTPTTPIPDTKFKLYGTSDYGNDIMEIGTTNAAGRLTFHNIELGTYTLEEIVPNSDYILNTTKWTVKVDEQGNVSIIEPEDTSLRDRLYQVENTGNAYVIYNEPRYWNFTLRKVDKENDTIWIEGAEFTLIGISDLGTEYNEVVESNEVGRVIFERIEKGTYILKETKAPQGVTETGAQGGNRNYIADPKEYIVKIDYKGDVVIDGLKTNDYGDFVVKNNRAYDGKITVVKKWEDNLTNEERPIPVVHLSTNEPQWKRGITVTKIWEGDTSEDRPEDITVHLVDNSKKAISDGEFSTTGLGGVLQNVDVSALATLIDSALQNNTTVYIDTAFSGHSYTDYFQIVSRQEETDKVIYTLEPYQTSVSDSTLVTFVILKDNSNAYFTGSWYTDLSAEDIAKYSIYYYDSEPIHEVSSPSGWTKNSDNTWTYIFDILLEDENANKEFYVWEEPVEGYTTENEESNPVLVENQTATITNTIKPWSAKYAVSLMGIGVDENQNGETMGLTFGPATGNDVNKTWTKDGATDEGYVNAYKSHIPTGSTTNGNVHRCLHNDDWATIIHWNNVDPYVYEQCINENCTHSVELHEAGETILDPQFEGVSTGDGPSMLYFELLQHNLISSYENLRWHPNNNMPNNTSDYGTNYGGWGASRIRAMLNGADELTDIGDGTAAKEGGTDIYGDGASGDIHKSASIYTSANNLLVAFPQELQDAIGKRATKYDSVYNSKTEANLKTSYDKLWLLSPNEIWNTSQNTSNAYTHPFEGIQYARFANGNSGVTLSTDSSQNTFNKAYRLYNRSAVGDTSNWWLRSSYSYYAYGAMRVDNFGRTYSETANNNSGVAPCFSLDTDYKFYTTKYAVQVYGIGQDTFEDGSTSGLTFGPALGQDFMNTYISHTPTGITSLGNAHRCIHDDDWVTIVEWNKLDPAVYEQCVAENCTHGIDLTLSDTLKNPNFVYGGSVSGDGVGQLYNEFNNSYHRSWNPITSQGTNKDGWGASRIRAMMNGYDELTMLKGSYSYSSSSVDSIPETNYTPGNILLDAFPQILQDNIGARKTLYDSVYNSKTTGNLKISYDKLWLLSPNEMTNNNETLVMISEDGERQFDYVQHPLESNGGYQKFLQNSQYIMYYNSWRPTSSPPNDYFRAYRQSNNTGNFGKNYYWVLRSSYSSNPDYILVVHSAGGVGLGTANSTSAGVSPCFALSRNH